MRTLVIATQHRKEQVLAPLFEREWGVRCLVPAGLDTDRFGMFTGERKRAGEAIDAARSKCMEAARLTGETLVLASEGSFGPHPSSPFVAANEELLLLTDFIENVEYTARELTLETNFHACEVRTWEELQQFAARAQFPSHGLILRESRDSFVHQVKGIMEWDLLSRSFHAIQSNAGSVYVETDMRACFNPTRMATIERAGKQLIETLKSICPSCGLPGFSVTDVMDGLPCENCSLPTRGIMAHVYVCQRCHFETRTWYPNGNTKESAMYCDHCNP